jgi:hypothetical protein
MKFLPIFVEENSELWSVCYPEDGRKDAFRLFINQVSDLQFLTSFFESNKHLLETPFWRNISVLDASLKVLDEALELERELKCLQIKGSDCSDFSIREVFEPLDKDSHFLQSRNRGFRKAKPNPAFFTTPMLRIYAIGLEDGTIIITGGAIKLTLRMEGEHFERVLRKLRMVKDYIQSYKIVSREGLL